MLKRLIIKTNFFQRQFISTIELTRNAVGKQLIQCNDLIEWLEQGQKTLLWRDEQCAQRYIEHQKLVDRDYRSINDFIRIHYLKWDKHFDENLRKFIAKSSSNSIREPIFTPNDFPYHLAETIQHWLIWFDPKPEQIETVIQNLVDREFPKAKFDRLTFVNPPRLRSVSDVFHAHVFVRKIKPNVV